MGLRAYCLKHLNSTLQNTINAQADGTDLMPPICLASLFPLSTEWHFNVMILPPLRELLLPVHNGFPYL